MTIPYHGPRGANRTKKGIISESIGVIVMFTVIMAAVLAVILMVIGGGTVKSFQDSFAMDSSARGTILTKEKGILNKTCHVTYEFEVNGVRYTGPTYDDVSISTYCHRILRTNVSVIYDSANPTHNTLSLTEILFGSKTLFYSIAIGWIPLWILGIISRIRMTRRSIARLEASQH